MLRHISTVVLIAELSTIGAALAFMISGLPAATGVSVA